MRVWQRKIHEIDPEEIFLDSSNLPDRDSSQFEGRISKPVSRRALWGVGVVFFLVAALFSSRAFILEVLHGTSYADISRNNSLDKSLIFATRGLILDRTGRELAWNTPQTASTTKTASVKTASSTAYMNSPASLYALRQYIDEPGFGHLLGFLRYPRSDATGAWWQESYSGVEGIELEYNTLLSGTNGATLVETNAHGKVEQTNIVSPPRDGEDLTLAIDADLQRHMYDALVAHAKEQGFRAGAGVIMDVKTGEVLALTSFPEYQSQDFTDGDAKAIAAANSNPLTPMLDRSVSGLYAPGSIMKTIFAAAALNEHLISPERQILSTGAISIPNQYDPTHPTLFHDWTVHGWIDMRTAIAVSSDEYFYTIGGGYQDQPGLGITRLDAYAMRFGIGTSTGIDIPGERRAIS
jgi:penicillin-binding protein 2